LWTKLSPQTRHHSLIPSGRGVAPAMSMVTPHLHRAVVSMVSGSGGRLKNPSSRAPQAGPSSGSC